MGKTEFQWDLGIWLRLYIKALAGLEMLCQCPPPPKSTPNWSKLDYSCPLWVKWELVKSVGMTWYSHYPGVDASTGGDCTPTHTCGWKKGLYCPLLIDFSDWCLNEIIESQTYLWNVVMLHSTVTSAVGKSEVNRCADENQRWVITRALTQTPPNLRVREGLPSRSLLRAFIGSVRSSRLEMSETDVLLRFVCIMSLIHN